MIYSRYFKYHIIIFIYIVLLLLPAFTECFPVNETISVQLIIDYGGVRRHYQVLTAENSSLLDVTLAVTEVRYRVSSLGAFVDSIGNVSNDPGKSMYWLWWYWDWDTHSWKLGPVASDRYQVKGGDILLWSYMETATWPPKTPKPLMSVLTIRVLEKDTGKPVSDVEIKVTSSTLTLKSVTNSTGWCTFQLPYGKYVSKVENTEVKFTIRSEEVFLLVKV